MAYSIIQQKDANTGSGTSISTGNFSSNPTAGNLIYVVTGGLAAAASFNAPTDTLGNTYVPIGTVAEAGTGSFATHWYAKNVAGGSANSVSASCTGTATSIGILAIEISGLDVNNPLNGHAEGQGSVGSSGPNAMTSGPATNTIQPALLIGFEWDLQGASEAAGTSPIAFTGLTPSWNNFGGSGVNNALAEHARLTTIGSFATTFQDTGFDRYVALAAIFIEQLTAPAVTAQPSNITVNEGENAQFTVSAIVSSGSLSYQWQDNRGGSFANCSDGSGATSATYNSASSRMNQAGRQFRCVVTDSNGSTNSNAAVMGVFHADDGALPRRRKRWGGLRMFLDVRGWW